MYLCDKNKKKIRPPWNLLRGIHSRDSRIPGPYRHRRAPPGRTALRGSTFSTTFAAFRTGVVHRAGIETRRNATRSGIGLTRANRSAAPRLPSSTSSSSFTRTAAIIAACPRDEEACSASHATARVTRTSENFVNRCGESRGYLR